MSDEKRPLRRPKIISIILFLVVLVIFGGYIYLNFDRVSQLFIFSPSTICYLAILAGIVITLNGTANYLLYRNLGIPISLITSIALATINTLANLLPFSGGLIAKGIYLKKRHNLAYGKYLSATGALYILFISINGIIGLISLLILKYAYGQNPPPILYIGYGLMSVCVGFFWFPMMIEIVPDRWKDMATRIVEGWHILRNNRGLFLKLSLVQITTVLVMASRFILSYDVFSQRIPLLSAILFSSATILTRLVSIIPGGIGIRETVVAVIGNYFGIEPSISAYAVAFDRLISTLLVLILGLFFSYYLGRDIWEREEDTDAPME